MNPFQDKQPNKGQVFFWTGITKQKLKEDEKENFVNQYTGEVVPWDLNLWPGKFIFSTCEIRDALWQSLFLGPVVGEGCTMARGPFLVS